MACVRVDVAAARPGRAGHELVTAFRSRAHLVDDAEGFVDLQVWQSDRDEGELIMVAPLARPRRVHRLHALAPTTRISHDRIPPDLAGRDQARAPRAPPHVRGRRRMSRRRAAPSGWPPPRRARGAALDLGALAAAVSDRYFERFPPRGPRALRRTRPPVGAPRHPAPAQLGDRRRRGPVDLERPGRLARRGLGRRATSRSSTSRATSSSPPRRSRTSPSTTPARSRAACDAAAVSVRAR